MESQDCTFLSVSLESAVISLLLFFGDVCLFVCFWSGQQQSLPQSTAIHLMAGAEKNRDRLIREMYGDRTKSNGQKWNMGKFNEV